MNTERLETTASLPVNIRQKEERILTPLYHSFVIGISWAAVTMLFFLILSIAAATGEVISEGTMTIILLVSLAAGVVAFVWAYVKRDAWLRSTSLLTSTLNREGQVHPPNNATPVAPASPGVDKIVRVSDSLLIRLQIPPELGITSQNIMDLALRISQGGKLWSRRSLKGIILENAYKEFSDILVDRHILKNAPNNGFSLTHEGYVLFYLVATGEPPPPPPLN